MFLRVFTFAAILAVVFVPTKSFAEQIIQISGANTNDRLSKAVTEQKLELDETARANIVMKCSGAQAVLHQLQQEADKSVRQRIDIYNSIQKDLQSIKLRMIRQGADASETDLLTGKLQQMLDQFTLQADRYGTTLEDLTSVACAQNPEQFKAGLVLARAQRAKLLDISIRLKQSVSDADKSIFDQLKKRLVL